MNTIEKEKRCLAITERYCVPEKPSISKRIVDLLKQAINEEPRCLLPLFLTFHVLLAPISIYEQIKWHRQDKKEYSNIQDKFLNFSGHKGEKNILELWYEYGLKPLNFIGDEKELILAQCLSDWIKILYEQKYHIDSEEIINMFKIQQKKQGKLYNEAYSNSGVRISLADWRVVVVDNILTSLPDYK